MSVSNLGKWVDLLVNRPLSRQNVILVHEKCPCAHA